MQTLIRICPLQPGKLGAYKLFIEEFTGPKNKDAYLDMLHRYDLKGATIHYQKLGNEEFLVVTHLVHNLDEAEAKLKSFPQSTNPFDQWFIKKMHEFYDFKRLEEFGGAHQLLNI